ncbi:uncharacterized protein J3D65DRAFT_420686 [Phyllosticta citribraziliensis]|uniref:Uncharacterized protein n=1 Tax=Phyllosticta citribraziliensis TaxID=989973 RepID=A0ABR1LHL6_9PEZI
MTFHQNSLLTYFHSNPHPPPMQPAPASPELPLHQHSSQHVNMSQKPDDRPSKPRSWSIQSATTDGTEGSRPMKSQPGKRSKHSWEYVVVDPTEDEAPPPTASRLQKELYSSFTNNFLGPRARRTRAGAGQSQPFHYKDGSDSSNSNTASESAFSSNRSNSAISPASSPAPPSRPAGAVLRKRKDSVAPTADAAPPRKKSKGPDPPKASPPKDANFIPIRQPFSNPLKSLPSSPEPPSASNSLMNGHDDAPRHVTSKPQPAARKSAVSEDGATKTPKPLKKTDTKPSPALSYNSEPPDKSKKDASPMTVDKDMPKPKKAKTGPAGAAKPQPKPALQQQHAQKRDSLLEENMPVHNKQPHQRQALQQSNQQNSVTTTAKQWKKQAQSYYAHSPTRAELAEQLEEITHRGIAGGPCNYNSWTEYRAACAAEAAWQERDQQVVERMLDNPHVVSVLKRLRELDHEIEAERSATVAAAKAVGKTVAKGGVKAKASGGKKKSVAAAGMGDR